MSTALQICAAAYRQANLDQPLTSFSTTQEYPYNLAIDLINHVIDEVNRFGYFWFTETLTSLNYGSGVYQYNLSSLGVDGKSIIVIRRHSPSATGNLTPMNYQAFQRRFRPVAATTAEPAYWARFGNNIELDVIPKQDYQLGIYHYRDMPNVVTEADALLLPVVHEDILQEGVLAYLCDRLGRSNAGQKYQLFLSKLSQLKAQNSKELAMPTQMPASF
jgi:hypothetical protein